MNATKKREGGNRKIGAYAKNVSALIAICLK